MQSIVESVLDFGIPTLSWNFQNSHCPQKHSNYIYKYTFYNALLVSVCSKAQTFFQTLHIAAGQGDADAMDGSLLSSTLLVAFGRVGRLKIDETNYYNQRLTEARADLKHSVLSEWTVVLSRWFQTKSVNASS